MIIKLATGSFAFCSLIAKSFFMTSVNFHFHRWIWYSIVCDYICRSIFTPEIDVHNIDVVNGVNIFFLFINALQMSYKFLHFYHCVSHREWLESYFSFARLARDFRRLTANSMRLTVPSIWVQQILWNCQIRLAMHFTWFVPNRFLDPIFLICPIAIQKKCRIASTSTFNIKGWGFQ